MKVAQWISARGLAWRKCLLAAFSFAIALSILTWISWPQAGARFKTIYSTSSNTTFKIPRIIHQTFTTFQIYDEYRSYIDGCVRLNPDWQYFFWRDEDIVLFIKDHFPFFMQKYLSFKMPVQRADSIRYMVLHHYGGIYIDMDIECVKPFNPSLSNLTAFVDQEAKEHAVILYGKEFSAMNSAMGSVRGHPFFLRLVFAMMEVPDSQGGAGTTTGPDLLTDQLIRWNRDEATRLHPVTLLDPAVFSPIIDNGLHNFRDLCRKIDLGKSNSLFDARALRMEQRKVELCREFAERNWQSDLTTSETVGRHMFLHLGYRWASRPGGTFHIREVAEQVKVYTEHKNIMYTLFNMSDSTVL